MVCEKPAFFYDFWTNPKSENVVEVTCLMPNSVIIPLTVSTSTSLHELKEVCLHNNFLLFCFLNTKQ